MAYQNTKWMKLYAVWQQRIACGEWLCGSKLPSLQELSTLFGISYLTSQKIIRRLADEGWVKIVHGRGIYASRPGAETVPAARLENVQLMMQVCGDFFSEIYLNFQRNLPRDYRIRTCVPRDFKNDPTAIFRHRLEELSETGCRALIVDGNHWFNFQALEACRPLPFPCTIAIHDFGRKQHPEFNRVLCDFEEAGYRAAGRLLEAGYERLYFLTHDRLDESEYIRRGLNGDISDLMLCGIRRACRAAGVTFPVCREIRHNYGIFGNGLLIRDLKEIMERSSDRLGFIAISDNRALPVYQAAENTRREIGSDVGIIGCFNCSGCCSQLCPPLTTIRFDETRIGAELAELTVSKAIGERVMISPELVERASVSREQAMVQSG